MRKFFIFFTVIIMIALLCGCGNADTSLARDIVFQNEKYEVIVGEELAINYTLVPETALNKTVCWKSYNESVATIENGVIKAKGVGKTKIAAYRDSVFHKEVDVIVVKQKKAIDWLEPEEKSFYYAFLSNISNFKDPSSVSIREIYESEDEKAWYIEVSGRNSFGGISIEQYTLTKSGTLTRGWYLYGASRYCAISKSLINSALEERYQ